MADIKLEVRPFDPERDLDEVLGLFELVFGWAPSRAIWEWKYRPPWSNRTYAWVSLVDGRIVGHAGVVPLRGLVNGQEVPFAQFTDVMVQPESKGRSNALVGPNIQMAAIRKENPHTVVYGFAGRRVTPLYQWVLGESTLVTECQEFVVSSPNSSMDGPKENEIRVQKWDWETSDIDRVWENARGTVKTGLIRDRSYVRWRYAGHPTHRYHLFGVYEGAEMVGWLVTGRIGSREDGLPEVRVVDLLLPKEKMLKALQVAATTVRAKAVVLWLPANFRPASVQTRETGSIVLHHFGDSAVATECVQDQLYYTLGEADEWWW